MLLVLSMSLKTFSQEMVLNNQDTFICFTVEKSAFLLNRVYQSEEYKTLDSLCELQNDSLYKALMYKQIVINQKKIIDNKVKQDKFTDITISELKKEKDEEHKKYLDEKTQKWVVVVLGIAISIFEYTILTP